MWNCLLQATTPVAVQLRKSLLKKNWNSALKKFGMRNGSSGPGTLSYAQPLSAETSVRTCCKHKIYVGGVRKAQHHAVTS